MTTDLDTGGPLLADGEPPPVQLERAAGRSDYFLTCDHAGARIPRRLASLGLPAAELQRHIAWDLGAAAVALKLAETLDATLVMQPYSRLVIDCNRPLHSAESIVTVSERTTIPGNRPLSAAQVEQRRRDIFMPYHACIRAQLDARAQRSQPTKLVCLHSFTPVYLGTPRPWHVGVLYHRDTRMAHALLTALRADASLVVGDNEPYDVSDDTDYTIPEYGERRGLPHVEIEIRQDLIADEAGQHDWALRLARSLTG